MQQFEKKFEAKNYFLFLDCLKEFRLKQRKLSDDDERAEIQKVRNTMGAKINELRKKANKLKKGHYISIKSILMT